MIFRLICAFARRPCAARINLLLGTGKEKLRADRQRLVYYNIAPYSYEGYMLNLGNGLAKAGQVDAAKVMYANARYAGNYATWPYRGVLEAIASSDLNARAALYADTDSTNDPPLGVPNRSCVYCHATVAEPGAH